MLFVNNPDPDTVADAIASAIAGSSSHFQYLQLKGKSAEAKEPFFPILPAIRDYLAKNSLDIDSIVEQAGIYYCHRDIFSSYLSYNKTKRRNTLITEEQDYEFGLLLDGIVGMLRVIAERQPLFIEITHLHLADTGLWQLLKRMSKDLSDLTATVLVSLQRHHRFESAERTESWDKFIEQVEDRHTIVDSGMGDTVESECYASDEQTEGCQALLVKLENTLNFQCYPEASDVFQLLLTHDQFEYLSADDMGRAYYLGGLALSYLQDQDGAIGYFQHAIDQHGVRLSRAVLSLLYSAKASSLAANMDYAEAEKSVLLALNFAELSGTDDELKKVLLTFYFIRYQQTLTMPFSHYKVLDRLVSQYQDQSAHAFLYKHALLYVEHYGSLAEVLRCCEEAVNTSEAQGNQFGLATAYHQLAITRFQLGEREVTLRYLLKSKDICLKLKDAKQMLRIYNGIGYVYVQMEDYLNAAAFFTEATDQVMSVRDYKEVASTILNIAKYYFLSRNYKKAMSMLSGLVKLLKTLDLNSIPFHDIGDIYVLKAFCHIKTDDHIKALIYLDSINPGTLKDDSQILYYIIRGHLAVYEMNLSGLDAAYQSIEAISGLSLMTEVSQLKEQGDGYKALGHRYADVLLHILVFYEQGQSLKCLGELERAKRAFAHCIDLCIDFQYPLYRELCVLEMSVKDVVTEAIPVVDIDIKLNMLLELAKKDLSLSRLHSRLRNIQFIQTVQRLLIESQSQEVMARNLLLSIETYFGIRHAWVFLRDGHGYRLLESMDGSPAINMQSIFEEAKEMRRIQWLEVEAYQAYAGENSRILCAPFGSNLKPVGYLLVGISASHEAFTQEELDALGIAAQQVKTTLERLERERLIEQTNVSLKKTMDELKQAQSELVEAEKMRSLTRLVSGVAHEINTPLGIGVTSSSMLAESFSRVRKKMEDTHQISKHEFENFLTSGQKTTELLESSIKRAANLVASFKQVAADGSNQEKVRDINVYEQLNVFAASVKPMLSEKHIGISIRGDADITIKSLQGPLHQLLSHLVVNSVDHAFDETIDNPQIAIDYYEKERWLYLVYRDNGVGIDETLHDQVFEPFYTTARHSKHPGLGLPVAYNIVKRRLRGSLHLENNAPHGVKITVCIPAYL